MHCTDDYFIRSLARRIRRIQLYSLSLQEADPEGEKQSASEENEAESALAEVEAALTQEIEDAAPKQAEDETLEQIADMGVAPV